MPKKRHPELEGYQSEPLYVFEFKSQKKKRRNRLRWMTAGILIGLGLATGMFFLLPNVPVWRLPNTSADAAADDPFQLGTQQAMEAAELTQSAEYKEDWSQVAILWQQAIVHMRSVPSSHPNHKTAQQKLEEYTRNLKYAQSNVSSRAPNNPSSQSYWTLGSDRELVFAIQGMPTQVSQYDTTCKEILYYGDSIVELRNGYVANYSDLDGNLAVLADDKAALSIGARENTWTVGSSQEEVFRIQGTPTRTTTYQDSVTLYYGDSFVEMQGNQVVGYLNIDNTLKVSMIPVPLPEGAPVPKLWDLGASRSEVLRVEQQTPTAVSRLDNSCEEVFDFENSTVKFRKGLVTEYSNMGENLQIQ